MEKETLVSVRIPMSDLAALQVLAGINHLDSAGAEIRKAIKEHLKHNKDKMAKVDVFVKRSRRK